MNDRAFLLLCSVITTIIGMIVGCGWGMEAMAKDCDSLGKFRENNHVYICSRAP